MRVATGGVIGRPRLWISTAAKLSEQSIAMINFIKRWWWLIATILFLALVAGVSGPGNIGVVPVQTLPERR
jgi:hypothetical protein